MNLLFIPLTIGLPAIDESLEKLLTAMETFPNVAVLGDAVSMAKALGLCLALCVGSYECWMMMLGRRGMDVMKLLRIIGISCVFHPLHGYARLCRFRERVWSPLHGLWQRQRTRKWQPSS